jgi:hypothetical protein
VGTFSAPELRLVADTARLRLDGTGQIGQSSVTVGWDEVFAPASDTPKTTLALSLGIDAADLAALGVDAEALGPAVTVRYGAPLSAEVRVRRDGGGIPPGATAFETTIDLRSTALSAPVLGVSKPRRAAATLRVDGVADTTGIELDRLQLDAADLRLRARARLDAARRLERLDIDSLRVGADTDLSASVVRVRAGFDATLRGRSLDASGLLAGGTGSAASGGPPIELRLLLDRLVLSPSLAVTEARGNLNRREDGSLAVVVNGSGPGAAALSVTLDRTAAGAGTLRASSSDAGALARGAGLFSRALGGRLDLSATLQRDGAIDGEAQVRDVILSDDPRLDSLLAGADLDEALARLRSEGIRFDTMRLPFRWDGGVITLRDAVAYGPVIGLTLSGSYTTATDDLAMDGVFTPLYGLNSLIGNLPLLGPLLTGGEGQGLLAFTFGLSGPAANPVVSVNPFSVLLPGVLRQILQPGPDSGPATPPD